MHCPSSSLLLGREVIRQEADALCRLADALGEDFVRAVDTLLRIEGRVAVTGMGKSGHIARKIAATLASTGTPAYYIHPTEASHGDLGMMAPRDALLALSWSGKSQELTDILSYAARHDLPIIAMTRNAKSPLGKQADICLKLPDTGEACPIDCAPTSSTTMSLALGDALAMALMHERGFTPEDFKDFHPGGALGKKLRLVRDVMHTDDALPLVKPDTPMSEVLLVMTGKGFGCAGVVDDAGALVGIITDGDLRRHMGPLFMKKRAADVMTPDPVTIDGKEPLDKALYLMRSCRITSLFAVYGEKPCGIVNVHLLLGNS